MAITSNGKFANQFIEFGGLEPNNAQLILNPNRISSSTLVDSLIIFSKFTRVSQYKAMLLAHPEATVCAKTCNLIGNTDFHSSDLYDELDDSIPIKHLIFVKDFLSLEAKTCSLRIVYELLKPHIDIFVLI
ncbi:hypothetical protein ACTFIY_011018 [Dictyostelium cf. discoideum]